MGNENSTLNSKMREIAHVEPNNSEPPSSGYKKLFFCVAESFDESRKFTLDYFVAYNNFL